jgi:hypothetical protein
MDWKVCGRKPCCSACFTFILGAFAYSCKGTITFFISVRPSVLPSIRPSVRPSVRGCQLGSHSTDFPEILFWNLSLKSVGEVGIFVTIGQKYRELLENLNTFHCCVDIKSPSKRCLGVKWHQAVRIPEEVSTLCERSTVCRYVYIAYLVLLGRGQHSNLLRRKCNVTFCISTMFAVASTERVLIWLTAGRSKTQWNSGSEQRSE